MAHCTGAGLFPQHRRFDDAAAAGTSGAASRALSCDAVVAITARVPVDALYQELRRREPEWADAGVRTVRCLGDALAPGLIVHAVYEGHRYARELEAAPTGEVAFKRHFHGAEVANWA